jgi:hypothetical protein
MSSSLGGEHGAISGQFDMIQGKEFLKGALVVACLLLTFIYPLKTHLTFLVLFCFKWMI